MTASRRSFLHLAGLGGLAAALERADARAWARQPARPLAAAPIRLSSNENSYGPGEKVVAVIRGELARVNRYPFATARQLSTALADSLAVPASHLALGCGSSQILDAAVMAFTTPSRGLVTAVPTFELPAERARQLRHPLIEVPVDDELALDLARMAEQATDAGLVYLCNPNNPTGTVHGIKAVESFIAGVRHRSPDAVVLVDEAYHEYVDRRDYASAIGLALEDPQVVVSRTFSKIYGMAGLRVGYAVGRPESLERLRPLLGDLTISHLSGASALAALGDPARVAEQKRLTRENRRFTADVFHEAGCRLAPSEANFVMVDVGRDIRQFQRACRARGIEIARPFPPLTTWARITIGTADEMGHAARVFREALAEPVQPAVRLPPLPVVGPGDVGWSC